MPGRKLVRSKRARTVMPLLPQHALPEPFSRMLSLGYGDFPKVYEEIAEILKREDANAGAEQLLKMVQDETYYDYDGEEYTGGTGGDPRGWTRLHALRVLSRMGDAAHIAIEPLLPLLNEEDDFLREDMPFFFAAMGKSALEPLAQTLADPDNDTYLRAMPW